MKKIITVLFLSIAVACNNAADDTVEKADSANESRRENNDVTDGKAVIATDKESSEFLVRALDGGMMEVALGNVAAQKGQSDGVKRFGAMMVADHGAANEKIRSLASMRTVTLPAGTSDEKTKMINEIIEKRGSDFDKKYINMMVDDHQKDIREFESALDKVKDSSVQTFIRETIPVLKKHLDSCTAIKKSMKH